MSVLSKLAGTFQTAFQLGKAGPKIKGNAGVVEAKNAADSAYADFKAAQVQGTTALLNGNILLEEDAGQLSVRNSADSAYLKILALTPGTGDTNAVATVGYINANPPTTVTVLKAVSIKSGSYATTYTSSATLPNTAIVTRCIVEVIAALDATITITVGTDEAGQASRFQGTADNDTQTIETYETTPFKTLKTTGGVGSDQKFLVTLSSLPTVGTVNIYFEYGVPTAW